MLNHRSQANSRWRFTGSKLSLHAHANRFWERHDVAKAYKVQASTGLLHSRITNPKNTQVKRSNIWNYNWHQLTIMNLQLTISVEIVWTILKVMTMRAPVFSDDRGTCQDVGIVIPWPIFQKWCVFIVCCNWFANIPPYILSSKRWSRCKLHYSKYTA